MTWKLHNMETKEIKEILSEIGITEDNCKAWVVVDAYDYNVNVYTKVVQVIEHFTRHIEVKKIQEACNELENRRNYIT